MTTYRVWEGYRGTTNGYDDSDYTVVECEGELIAAWESIHDTDKGTSVRVYQTEENTVVIHSVNWSNNDGDGHNGFINEYKNIQEAAADGWQRILEKMHLIQQRPLSLREWREQKRK